MMNPENERGKIAININSNGIPAISIVNGSNISGKFRTINNKKVIALVLMPRKERKKAFFNIGFNFKSSVTIIK